MRVAHIVSNLRGGAGIAARRLSEALNNIDVESTIVCRSGSPDAPGAIAVDEQDTNPAGVAAQRVGWLFLDAVQDAYITPNRSDLSNTLFTLDYVGIPIAHQEAVVKADIINLHWTSYFQSTESLEALFGLGKPIVWTMHDMNPFTGGCHYSAGCTRFTVDCSLCPQLSGDPAGAAAIQLAQRKAVYGRAPHLAVVTPSVWLANEARRSTVLSSARIETISNSVDPAVFDPDSRAAARRALRVADSAVCIAFVPLDRTERRKGFVELAAALSVVAERVKGVDVRLVVLGESAETTQFGFPTIALATTEREMDVAAILSACDISITPSIEDNLPNTILEAMACGVPVVAFDVGGARDAIVNGESGALVAVGDSRALADTLVSLVSNSAKRQAMGQAARKRAVNLYTPKRQAEAYRALYASMAKARSGGAARPASVQIVSEKVPKDVLIAVWPTFFAYIASAHQDALDQVASNRAWAEQTEKNLSVERERAKGFEDWAKATEKSLSVERERATGFEVWGKRSDAMLMETRTLLEAANRWATTSDEEVARQRERADEMEKWARKSDDARTLQAVELQEALAWARASEAKLQEATLEIMRSDQEIALQANQLEEALIRARSSDVLLQERDASIAELKASAERGKSLLEEVEAQRDTANSARDGAISELAALQIRAGKLTATVAALDVRRAELEALAHDLETTTHDLKSALTTAESELNRTWKRRWARWTKRAPR